jgi:nucleosome binding factor SPN SPT16 subunit
MPFTVITLSEVNLVNLERVGFNLRNFDMVFIWKDLNRDVGRIDTIPQQSLETIKDWLTSIEIKYYESKVNLNWKNIFKSIKEDPEGFVEDGGWNFLDADQSDSEQSAEDESDFAPSDAEDAEDEESEEESSDESVVESDDDSDVELDSEEEEGLDWDQLEKQAVREDRQKEFSDDEETRMKRKRAEGGGGGSKKSRR